MKVWQKPVFINLVVFYFFNHLYYSLPLPPAHEHSDIYLQLCFWDNYVVFLIALHIITRPQLYEIYHLWNWHRLIANRTCIDYYPSTTSVSTNQVRLLAQLFNSLLQIIKGNRSDNNYFLQPVPICWYLIFIFVKLLQICLVLKSSYFKANKQRELKKIKPF